MDLVRGMNSNITVRFPTDDVFDRNTPFRPTQVVIGIYRAVNALPLQTTALKLVCLDDADTMVFYSLVQTFINRLECCVVFATSNFSTNMLQKIEAFGALRKTIINLTNRLPPLTYNFITNQDESDVDYDPLHRYNIVEYICDQFPQNKIVIFCEVSFHIFPYMYLFHIFPRFFDKKLINQFAHVLFIFFYLEKNIWRPETVVGTTWWHRLFNWFDKSRCKPIGQDVYNVKLYERQYTHPDCHRCYRCAWVGCLFDHISGPANPAWREGN